MHGGAFASILTRTEVRALPAVCEVELRCRYVSILARTEVRALQSACNVMTFNVEKRTLREPQLACF